MQMLSFDTAWQLAAQHAQELRHEADVRRLAGKRRHWWSRRTPATSSEPIVTPLPLLPTVQESASDGLGGRRAA